MWGRSNTGTNIHTKKQTKLLRYVLSSFVYLPLHDLHLAFYVDVSIKAILSHYSFYFQDNNKMQKALQITECTAI